MTENDFLGAVIELSRLLDIRTAHFRPAKTSAGWRTPVQGEGAGWPDLVLVGPGGLMFRELKSAKGVLSPEQRVWLASLTDAGADAGVWRPADLTSGRVGAEMTTLRRASVSKGCAS